MTARTTKLGWLLLVGIAAIIATVLSLQHYRAQVLREEAALFRGEQQRSDRLRALHRSLVAAQPAEADLQRLRSDRAAVARLRNEVASLQTRVTERERALAREAETAAPSATKSMAAAVAVALTVDANSQLWLDQTPVDVNVLRQRLSGLPRGSTVNVELRLPRDGKKFDSAKLRREHESLGDLARELGIRMEIRVIDP